MYRVIYFGHDNMGHGPAYTFIELVRQNGKYGHDGHMAGEPEIKVKPQFDSPVVCFVDRRSTDVTGTNITTI